MTMAVIAIGGGTALGVGGSLAGAFIGSNAAKKAAGQQESALYAQFGQQQSTLNQMLNYFDPFKEMGLQAGQALTSELYSPQQQTQQAQASIDQLNRQLMNLNQQAKGYETGQGVPLLQGDNASERRKTVWLQMIDQNNQQRVAIQNQIKAQQGQLQRAETQAANPNAQAEQLQQNPMFTAGQNVISRKLAAQGLQGSQEAIRQEGTLAANVYENQIQNQLGIYQPAVAQAGQMAGNIGQVGLASAQTLGGIGQAQAQGTIGAANALTGGISGAANALTGAGSALLNYNLYSKLIGNMNTGAANTGANYQMGGPSINAYGNPTTMGMRGPALGSY